jgi:serine/threonine protein kinase
MDVRRVARVPRSCAPALVPGVLTPLPSVRLVGPHTDALTVFHRASFGGDCLVDEPTASDTPSGLRPGSRFGHYRLKRLLGRGGYGEVYEAEDTLMDRAVALKLLAAPYSQNQAFRLRLHREARNAGKLHEPHVVPIHHCGEIDGQLYIDMRLIEGSDLQKVLALRGPLSPARAVAIVRQIAGALDAAHSVQMVHREHPAHR